MKIKYLLSLNGSRYLFTFFIIAVVSTCSVYSLPFGGDLECSVQIFWWKVKAADSLS